MSRFLAFGNVRRVTHSLLPSRNTIMSQVKSNGLYKYSMVEFPYTLWRLYYQNIHSFAGDSPFLLRGVRHSLLNCRESRNFYTHYLASSFFSYYSAQIAWKRFSQVCLYNRTTLLCPIKKIACAVSLALTRSNLVAPGVIAFIFGELAWTRHRTWAEAESTMTRDARYKQTRDGHIDLTAVLLSFFRGHTFVT